MSGLCSWLKSGADFPSQTGHSSQRPALSTHAPAHLGMPGAASRWSDPRCPPGAVWGPYLPIHGTSRGLRGKTGHTERKSGEDDGHFTTRKRGGWFKEAPRISEGGCADMLRRASLLGVKGHPLDAGSGGTLRGCRGRLAGGQATPVGSCLAWKLRDIWELSHLEILGSKRVRE